MTGPDAQWVSAAGEHLIRYRWQCWWYGDSVGFEGLLAATDLTGDPRFQDFAYGMAKFWLGRRQPRRAEPGQAFHWSDHTAPGAAMVELARRYQDDELMAGLTALADWLLTRPQAGGVPLLDPGQALCAWVDCMQFHGPFLARLAEATGEPRYREAALWFLLGHDRVLRDDSDLYCHIYDLTTHRTNGVHWGRGQGWAMLGLWQTLALLPDGTPEAGRIRDLLSAHLAAMTRWQTPEGSWRTVVDDPSSYPESSVAAFYLATILPAIAAGALDGSAHEKATEQAAAAFDAALAPGGHYRGVSANTHAGDACSYLPIPRGVTVPWGHGPALLAAAALPAKALSAKAPPAKAPPANQTTSDNRWGDQE